MYIPEQQISILEEQLLESVFYIYYQKTSEEPENIVDEYRMKGICKNCSECCYFELPHNVDGSIDKRAKKGFCNKNGVVRWKDSAACEVLYMILENKKSD